MNAEGFLWLRLEATANNTPEGVAIEMARVANHLGIGVHVDFNNLDMTCFPGDTAEDVAAEWRKRAKLPKPK